MVEERGGEAYSRGREVLGDMTDRAWLGVSLMTIMQKVHISTLMYLMSVVLWTTDNLL